MASQMDFENQLILWNNWKPKNTAKQEITEKNVKYGETALRFELRSSSCNAKHQIKKMMIVKTVLLDLKDMNCCLLT